MDRQIIYPGAIPLETDLLSTNKNAMIGLAKLASAVLGTSTLVNGLAVTPNSPAAMNVIVAPGEIYALSNIDGSAYSSLASDTTNQILKQGISLDVVTLSCAAPGTSGYSINYLIQATYQDVDSGSTVLPYYNASNPAQAYSGPANSGTSQNTVRKGAVILSAKAGVAATTGTQTTPTPDSGYVGLYVVTVANGATTIVSGNITAASGAPIISERLTDKISKATADTLYAAIGSSGVQANANNTFTKAQRGAVVALTDGATITPDFATSNNFEVTLGGNRTLANPTNLVAGQSGVIKIIQGGTGSRTLAYGSYFKFAGGAAPKLTTTAGAVDVLAYYAESATRITASLIKDVK